VIVRCFGDGCSRPKRRPRCVCGSSEITKSRKVFPRTVVLASSGKLSINQVRKLS
jgi:hypothetical protein